MTSRSHDLTASVPVSSRSKFNKPPLRTRFGDPAAASASEPSHLVDPAKRALKFLVWAYFWLLLLEGALRKWIVPQLSAPLLIVRDPVVILIYIIAIQRAIVPHHKLFAFLLFQCAGGFLLMISQLILLDLTPYVLLYGYRTLFLHFPLIFLLPHILNYRDVIQLGKWTLVVSIPMAALMAYQFNSPADTWINRTVGMTGTQQLSAAFGKIRPPGTFSFISGPVAFFAIVTAFAGYGFISQSRPYPKWLLGLSLIGLGLAVAVSGSRATILSGGIVIVAWLVGAAAGRRFQSAVANSLIVVLIAILVLGQIELFHEGREVLDQRFEFGRDVEAEQGGLLGRFFNELISPLKMLSDVPFFGAGLGIGTNVGATLLTGRMQFLLSEGEWGRLILEMGPLFGGLFIWFRIALAFYLGKKSLQAAKSGQLLPLLLFSGCAVNLLSGQIAQPTTLGFTVLVAGLCLASLEKGPEERDAEKPSARFGRFIKSPLRS